MFVKAAGLSKKFARTIGIAVDHRRRYEMFIQEILFVMVDL